MPEADICPKCGAAMELVKPDRSPIPPSRLCICPNCKLLAWDDKDG